MSVPACWLLDRLAASRILNAPAWNPGSLSETSTGSPDRLRKRERAFGENRMSGHIADARQVAIGIG